MSKINVGDRVKIVREFSPYSITSHVNPNEGKLGVVIELRSSTDFPYRVRLDNGVEDIFNEVARVKKVCAKRTSMTPTIVITTDGKTTTAVKRVGKTVVSKSTSVCSDDDEFDFDVGAAVAISRLIGGKYHVEETKPKPKNYTGKVVCLESKNDRWTPGKCYEVSDGFIYDNFGLQRVRTARTFEDFFDLWWGKYGNPEARFAEVVESDG